MSDMTGKQLKEELGKYKRQYRLIVNRCEQLEKQNNKAEEMLEVMRNNLLEAQKSVDLNKALLRQTMEEHSKKEHGLVALMNGMKAKLREMGYDGNFDNLGNESN
jgi:predicted  nucleic acid-binding Zn-ribbon protein